MYVNVGARDFTTKEDYPTKAALKRAIMDKPDNVEFYGTSAIPGTMLDTGTVDMLGKGVKYSVTGPNPYTSRKWYATVEIKANGTIYVN